MMIVYKFTSHLRKTLAFGMENSLKEVLTKQMMGKLLDHSILLSAKMPKLTAISSILPTAMTSPRNGTLKIPNGLHDLQTYFLNNMI